MSISAASLLTKSPPVLSSFAASAQILVEELKRLHGVDFEGIRAATRLREEHEQEMLFSELNATLEKFMRRGGP